MAEPQRRRRLNAQVRREQILEVAQKLFIDRGFQDVGMADIAAELGTSRPNIYGYFPSTEAILDAQFENHLQSVVKRMKLYLQARHTDALLELFKFVLRSREVILLLRSGGGPTFHQKRQRFLLTIEAQLLVNLKQSWLDAHPFVWKVLRTVFTGLIFEELPETEQEIEELAELYAYFYATALRSFNEGLKESHVKPVLFSTPSLSDS